MEQVLAMETCRSIDLRDMQTTIASVYSWPHRWKAAHLYNLFEYSRPSRRKSHIILIPDAAKTRQHRFLPRRERSDRHMCCRTPPSGERNSSSS
jgi:hypothetical protein